MKHALLALLFAASTACAQIKISELPAASTLTGTEATMVTQGGVSKKATITQINAYTLTASGTLSGKTISGSANTISNVDFVASLVNLPSTLAGHGITDGLTAAAAASTYATIVNLALKAPIDSPTFTGTVTGPTFVGALTGNASTATSTTSFSGSLVGDVTGTQGATVVSTVNSVSAANVAAGATLANTATSVNTASAIVKRDGSGNFTAGTITAALNGNASTVSTNANLTGPVTSTGNATAIANGAISNAMLANGAVANLSGTNTGDQDLTGYMTKAVYDSRALGFITGHNGEALGATGGVLNFDGGVSSPEMPGGTAGSINLNGGNGNETLAGGNGGNIEAIGVSGFSAGSLIMTPSTELDAGSISTAAGGSLIMGSGTLQGGGVNGTILTTAGNGSGLTALNASNLGSGTVPTVRLGSGTANSTTYLRGDQTWQTISSGITIGTTTSNGTAGRVLYTDGTNVQAYPVTGSGSAVLGTSPTITGLAPSAVTGTAAILGANTFTGAQKLPDGTASAPAIAFTTTGSPGIYAANSRMDFAFTNSSKHTFWNDGSIYQNDTAAELKIANRVSLYGDASNVLAQRASTSPQISRIYNTWTSATNYERAAIEWASNLLRIGTQKGSGGGTARDMILISDDTERVRINSSAVTLAAGLPLAVASGSNQRAGDATLVGGTVTVSNTTVTANTRVFITRKTAGGTLGMALTYTVSAATSFTITSDNVLDTSVVSYFLVEVP